MLAIAYNDMARLPVVNYLTPSSDYLPIPSICPTADQLRLLMARRLQGL
jgi:hypothetical protein